VTVMGLALHCTPANRQEKGSEGRSEIVVMMLSASHGTPAHGQGKDSEGRSERVLVMGLTLK